MTFSEEVIKTAWTRAGGRCECNRSKCGHVGKCRKTLMWEHRGKETEYGWEAHHILSVDAGGSDTLDNCEILCQECHKNTGSYGG